MTAIILIAIAAVVLCFVFAFATWGLLNLIGYLVSALPRYRR